MNILSVCTELGGGADSWRIQNVNKQLEIHGNRVQMLENPSLSKANWVGKLGRVARAEVRTLTELGRDSYDFVYGNGQATFYCLLSKVKRVPLVFDMHGFSVDEYLQRYAASEASAKGEPAYAARFVIDGAGLLLADTIVCVSRKQMRFLNWFKGVPLDKMVYATNGADLDYFKPRSGPSVESLRQRLGLEGKLVFGYLGTTYRGQGVERLEEAAEALGDPEVAILIVGGQQSLTKGNLVVVERQPRESLLDYYAVCDVLVLPLPMHGATAIASPTKFAEYAAMGKPIMATEAGDPPDFVREYECGFVIPDNSAESLAEGVARFKAVSRGKLELMGVRSRQMAEENFDWDRIGTTLVESLLKYQR